MTNTRTVVSGVILLGISVLGFLYPVNDTGWTVPQINQLCSLEQPVCSVFVYITYGIYGSGLIGIILVIVGVIIPSKSKYYLSDY